MNYNLDIPKSKVLLVDDQRSFQLMMKGMLGNLGFQRIDCVDSGEAAVKLCKEFEYDLLLVDYYLGAGRKNGRQLLEELRSKKLISPRALYIIVTGENTREMVMGAVEMQPDDYIMKPFSTMQMRSRVQRAFNKKMELENIYTQLQEQNYEAAILNCRSLVREGSKYANFCRNLMAELYCKVGEYDKSVSLLKEFLAERDMSWAKIALGKTYTEMGEYQEAIFIFEEQIKRHPLLLDAYDYLARCHIGTDEYRLAQDDLQKAIEISPLSLSRQQKLAEVASINQAYELAKESSQQVYELSKRSVHQSSEHFCNYVRSAFECAEHAEEDSRRHKVNQEAMNAIFRAKQENFYGDFDYDAFEGLCRAALHANKGEHIQAKKTLFKAAHRYLSGDQELPIEFSPEALHTLVNIGEFEIATDLAERMEGEAELDQRAQAALQLFKGSGSAQDRLKQFKEHNRLGMSCYDSGDFEGAMANFNKALAVAPTNTGAALNCIQSTLQLLKSQRKPDQKLILTCQQHFKLLDGVPLPVHHKERYNELKQQLLGIKQKR